MYDRIFKPEKQSSFFIFGARGTGKTSWLGSHYKSAIFFDLLEAETLFDLRSDHNNLEKRIPPGYRGAVIIDEVQKLPLILDEVHRLIEKNKRLQFVLTGSSARKLKRSGVNLMAGRALVRNFYPLTAEELGSDFNISKALKTGLLPAAYTSENPDSFLKAYVLTYLDVEVRLEGLAKDMMDFTRFLQAASFSQGSLLNVSTVASDCAIERRTVSNYFELLRDILLSYELPVFSKRAKRELIKHRKFYFFDAGVFRILRPRGPLDSESEMSGPAMETLVLQELMAINSYNELGYEISTWHTKNHEEVDFVLYGPKGFFAIEVKSGSRFRESEAHCLELFAGDYPQAHLLYLYGGDRHFSHGKIEVMPLDKFFKNCKKLIAP
ncbi:MAG: hypothetical protein A2583_04545 [Bdellovibrionales bacterium RIFOXYD1_FULL_53_11]|nr:MAG: hypothetical protein A2583_04545 [Bdellovibrionales bacterium RIFOXYD1_FULL_53_11]